MLEWLQVHHARGGGGGELMNCKERLILAQVMRSMFIKYFKTPSMGQGFLSVYCCGMIGFLYKVQLLQIIKGSGNYRNIFFNERGGCLYVC